MKKLVGLIAVSVAVVMVITMFPNLVDNFKLAWEGTTGVWEQIKAVVEQLWSYIFPPFVLLLLGLIALDDK